MDPWDVALEEIDPDPEDNREWADPAELAEELTKHDARPFVTYRHTQFIMAKLVDAAMGKYTRLIINLPGRTGKTTDILWFLVWLFDRRPESRSIYTTYGDELARDGGIFVRDTLRDHGDVLRCQLQRDRQKQDRFKTSRGGRAARYSDRRRDYRVRRG